MIVNYKTYGQLVSVFKGTYEAPWKTETDVSRLFEYRNMPGMSTENTEFIDKRIKELETSQEVKELLK